MLSQHKYKAEMMVTAYFQLNSVIFLTIVMVVFIVLLGRGSWERATGAEQTEAAPDAADPGPSH